MILRTVAASGLRYLEQQVTRFETFHAGNFRLLINEFCDWFVRDDVTSILSASLRQHLYVSPQAWFEAPQQTGALMPLPEDPAACMALRFACLRYVRREKIDLRNFVTNHYTGKHLNEMLMQWKRVMVHPFAADCRTLVRELPLGDDEWLDLGPIVDAYLAGPFQTSGFGPRSWGDADDAAEEAAVEAARAAPVAPAAEPAAPAAEPVAAAAGLAEALDALEAAVGERSDLLQDVQALRVELRRPTWARERALARLQAVIRSADDLREPGRAVRRLLP